MRAGQRWTQCCQHCYILTPKELRTRPWDFQQKNPAHLYLHASQQEWQKTTEAWPPPLPDFQVPSCFHDGLGTLVIKDSRKYVVFYFLSEGFRKAYYKGVEMELSECICNIWHERSEGERLHFPQGPRSSLSYTKASQEHLGVRGGHAEHKAFWQGRTQRVYIILGYLDLTLSHMKNRNTLSDWQANTIYSIYYIYDRLWKQLH